MGVRGVVKVGNRIVFIFVRIIRNSGFLKEREYSSLCVLFVKTVCVDGRPVKYECEREKREES